MALLLAKTIFGQEDIKNPFYCIGKKGNNDVCINNTDEYEYFCKTYALAKEEFPGQPWLKIKEQLKTNNVRWEYMIPKEKYEAIVIQHIQSLINEIKSKTTDKLFYAAKVLPIEKEFLSSFKSVCFADETEKEPYQYKRTIVGRFISYNSINLFLMNQERRESILDSRFLDGNVVSLDFKALEPRTMLAINNPDLLQVGDDVYTTILNQSQLTTTRETIKASLLRILNGASIQIIRKDTNLTQEETIALKAQVFEIFKHKETIEKLKQQIEQYGRIFNYFGRPIIVENLENENLLFTYYMQSTSADICLIGFHKILKAIQKENLNKKIIPIAMIYDSFILDTKQEYNLFIEENLVNNITIKLNGNNVKFPLTFKNFKHK